MEWLEFKKRRLALLEKDKRIDVGILPLLRCINSFEEFCTSSSCAGRITLLSILSSKKDAEIYAKWHEPPSFEEFVEKLSSYRGRKPLWFRCEPFILHVFARDFESALNFMRICRRAGIKRGGIQFSREFAFIEIEGTHGFALPVKGGGKQLVSKGYLRLIVNEANKNLVKNALQIMRLEGELESVK
ncbi:MAG: hypothetical protein QXP42_00880 [Candidatus Micrarchaeia archaeon]